jgi:hypothetical protein
MRIRRAGNDVHRVTGINQRLAEIAQIHTLAAAMGLASIAEQGNAQGLDFGWRGGPIRSCRRRSQGLQIGL